jgi:SAM-dependent methyltransferase
MAHFSSTQYNSISKEYDAVNGLPISKAIVINVERVLSPHIKGAKVLELACGTGFFTRHLLRWGATSVVGIDISQGMIDIAQADFSTTPDASKCKFMVADCTQPFDVGTEGYDLVFAAWLLNYSPDEATAAAIFENISKHLKPGGRLVTVMPHPEEDPIVSPVWRLSSVAQTTSRS